MRGRAAGLQGRLVMSRQEESWMTSGFWLGELDDGCRRNRFGEKVDDESDIYGALPVFQALSH